MPKIDRVRVTKWGNDWTTEDSTIPELTAIHAKQKEEHYELTKDKPTDMYYGNAGPNLKKLKVVFNSKIINKIPTNLTRNYHRRKQTLILDNVYYNIRDSIMYINFFTKIYNWNGFTLEDITIA